MSFNAASSLLLLQILIGCLFSVPVESENHEEERIIAGLPAAPGQFPWAVALHYNGRFICTASVIAPNAVLTAAHCVVLNRRQQPAFLFHGVANVIRFAPRQIILFRSVAVHPGYSDGTVNNDIAVFTTTEPIEFDDEVGQLCIARPDTDEMEYSNATIMGWGSISPIRFVPIIPPNLQYASQLIIPNLKCSILNVGVDENKICSSGGFSGVCNGDSGGPLVHLSENNEPVEIGIASYINGIVGCGKIVPAVFTRVSKYYDFIMQNAGPEVCTV